VLRIKELTIDGDVTTINCTATILRRPLSSRTWEYFGIVTTSNPDQIQGLHNWLAGGYDIAEQEFFGV
jgi:hypothetical protein